jgi:hypothetical protein
MGSQAAIWLRTLAKNSALSLTSSVYSTVIPVCCWKTCSVEVSFFFGSM